MARGTAVDAAQGRFRDRHGRVDGKVAIAIELGFYAGNQLLIFLWREPFLPIDQIVFQAGDGVAAGPILEQLARDVLGCVVDGVALHAHHLGLDERGPFAAAGALAGFVRGVVDLTGIGAVDDDPRQSYARRGL